MLIIVSLCVSALIAWRWRGDGFLLPLWLGTSTSFVAWLAIRMFMRDPLTEWVFSVFDFVPGSLSLAAACFLIVWCGRSMVRRARGPSRP